MWRRGNRRAGAGDAVAMAARRRVSSYTAAHLVPPPEHAADPIPEPLPEPAASLIAEPAAGLIPEPALQSQPPAAPRSIASAPALAGPADHPLSAGPVPTLGLRERVRAYLGDLVPMGVRELRWRLDARAVAVLGGLAVVAVAVCFLAFVRSPRAAPAPVPVSGALRAFGATATPGDSATVTAPASTAAAEVVVDVAGKVVHPGVVTLPAGSRVVDAIDAAGGALPGVDLSTLNLARVLLDGEQVAVGIDPAPGGAAPGGSASPSAPLDLNTATAADLDGLPGVGPVLAARIVAWREEHGRFTRVDELLEVSGIGDATLADLAPLVRV